MSDVDVFIGWISPNYCFTTVEVRSEEVSVRTITIFMSCGSIVKILGYERVLRNIEFDLLDYQVVVLENS